MTTSEPSRHFKTSSTVAIVACLLLSYFVTSTDAQSPTNQAVPQDAVGKTYTTLVPKYASISSDDSIKMSRDIENQQEAIKADLASQLKQGNLSDESKSQVINLVGDLMCYQAVYLLIQDIDFRYYTPRKDGAPLVSTASLSGDGYVARSSLVAMGNTSFYAILEVIGSRVKDVPFDQAHVNGYCWTLNALRGKTFTTQQLNQQLAVEKDPKVQAQYRSVLARMKAFPVD